MTQQPERLRRAAWKVVVGQLACTTALTVAFAMPRMFMDSAKEFLLGLAWMATIGISTLVVVIWLLARPRRADWGPALLALVANCWLWTSEPMLSTWSYMRRNQARLETLTQDVLAGGRIQEMFGSREYSEWLESPGFSYRPAGRDSLLVGNDEERRRYEHLREELRRLNLSGFSVQPRYVAFIHSGFLDNSFGFLWVREGHAPPTFEERFFFAKLVGLRPLGRGWYMYSTT